MFRIVFLSLLLSTPAAGQTSPSGEGDARVQFERVQDGYLRLDSRSGNVSLCSRRTSGWVCEAVPEERATLESEIARLQSENAALKQELTTRGLKVPETANPAPPPAAKGPDIEIRLPTSADIDRALSFLESMWRRFLDMFSAVQKEVLKT